MKRREGFGCFGPLRFDSAYHPGYRDSSKTIDLEGSSLPHLAMQLCELELPHPFRKELLKLTTRVPEDWLAIHPLPEFERLRDDAFEDFFA